MPASAEAKGIEIRAVECDGALVVDADPDRLRQVVRNLLDNAVKFTDSGHVAVRAIAVGDAIRIEVSDTGIGIDAGSQSGLFVPFARITPAGSPVRPGTGLGLAISRRLVEAMGGVMELESVPGQGSKFWFVLSRHA